MELQPIEYGGRLVAVATRDRFFLADPILARAMHDPVRVFTVYMCAYAREVLRDSAVGPYTNGAARAFARQCLIPDELLEREHLDVSLAAAGLGVPQREMLAALRTHRR